MDTMTKKGNKVAPAAKNKPGQKKARQPSTASTKARSAKPKAHPKPQNRKKVAAQRVEAHSLAPLIDARSVVCREKLRVMELRCEPGATRMDSNGQLLENQILFKIPANPQKWYSVADVECAVAGLVPPARKATTYNRNSRMYRVRSGLVHLDMTLAGMVSGEVTIFSTSNVRRDITPHNVLNVARSLPTSQVRTIKPSSFKSTVTFPFQTGVSVLDNDSPDSGEADLQLSHPGFIVAFVSAPIQGDLPVASSSEGTAPDRSYNGPIANVWFEHETEYFGYEVAPDQIDLDPGEHGETRLELEETHAVATANVIVSSPAYAPASFPAASWSAAPAALALPNQAEGAVINTIIESNNFGEVVGTTGFTGRAFFGHKTLRYAGRTAWKAVSVVDTAVDGDQHAQWSVASVVDGFVQSAIGGLFGPIGTGIYSGLTALFGDSPANIIVGLIEDSVAVLPTNTADEIVQTPQGSVSPLPGFGWPCCVRAGGAPTLAAGYINQGSIATYVAQTFQAAYPDLYAALLPIFSDSNSPGASWFLTPSQFLFEPNLAAGQPALLPENECEDADGRIGFWEVDTSDGLELKPGFGQPLGAGQVHQVRAPRAVSTHSTKLAATWDATPGPERLIRTHGRMFFRNNVSPAGPLAVTRPVWTSGSSYNVGSDIASMSAIVQRWRFGEAVVDTDSADYQVTLYDCHLSKFQLSTGLFGRPMAVKEAVIKDIGTVYLRFKRTIGESHDPNNWTSNVKLLKPGVGYVWMLTFPYNKCQLPPPSIG